MKKFFVLLTLFVALLVCVQPVMAQEGTELALRLRRDFGYSSGAGDIQGTFTMTASGPENLSRVVFYLDEQSLGEVTQPPFALRFNTDNHSLGLHTLYAVGETADGRELRSNEIKANFVSADEGWQAAMRMAGPILGLVFGVMILSFVATFLTGGKQKSLAPGAPRNYGWQGGGICPKCQRPFQLHLFAPNMVTGKLERCPFCGKWSIVRHRSLAELRTAEAAELQDAQAGQAQVESEEERLRKELDGSRFQDL